MADDKSCGQCGARLWDCRCGEGRLRDAVEMASLTGEDIVVDFGLPPKDSYNAQVSGVLGEKRCQVKSDNGRQCELEAHDDWSHWAAGAGAFGKMPSREETDSTHQDTPSDEFELDTVKKLKIRQIGNLSDTY